MADREITTIPNGPLGIIALPGCEEMAEKIEEIQGGGGYLGITNKYACGEVTKSDAEEII